MAQCYHRKLAYLTADGLEFSLPHGKDYRKVSIPCGKCVACRVNNAAQWATRVCHEMHYADAGCFVTLTYDPDHCPSDYSLSKRDLQLFLKRLRIYLERHNAGRIRAFFAVGEYGSKFGRPHYHVCLIGWQPDDLVFHANSYSCMPIYTSKTLESIWGKGFCPVGTVTSGSAAYVARYSKKVGDNCGNRTRSFFLSSRNIPLSNGQQGALGAQWVLDNHAVLRLGYVHHPEKPTLKCRIPDYYFDLLKRWFPEEYELIKQLRYDFAVDEQEGIFCVDYHGKSTAYAEREFTDDERVDWSQKLSSDLPLTTGEILSILSSQFEREENAQLAKLLKLARNYD